MRSVARKLATLNLIGALMVVVVMYLVLEQALTARMQADFAAHADVIAASLAKSVEPALIEHDLPTAQSALDAVLQIPGVQWAFIEAPDGKVLAHTFVPQFPPALRHQLGAGFESRVSLGTSGSLALRARAPVLTGIVGQVNVGFSLDTLQSSIHAMESRILISIIIVMGAFSLLIAWLTAHIISPIRYLTRAAREFQRDTCQEFQPLPVASNDEIGILTAAFNSMAQQVCTQQSVLEQTVSARTQELHATNRGLAESQSFLEQAGAISGVGGFRIDLFSGSQVWTRQTFNIYEIAQDVPPSAEDLDKLMDPAVASHLWQTIRAASDRGEGYDLEIPLRTARGRPIWVRTIGVVEFENGRPARVVGAIQDITDRKNVDEALRITSQRFSLAADAAGIGVWEWDPVSDSLRWDGRMYRIYGIEPIGEAIPVTSWASHVHVSDRDRAAEELKAAPSIDSVIESEFRIVMPSGEIRHLRTAAKTQRDADGQPHRMVGIAMDITRRKAAEQALVDSESKFRTLFELSPVGIALNDLQTGHFLHFNDALVEPSGFTREELLGLTYGELTPPQFRAVDLEALKLLKDTARYGPYEKEYYRKDGSTYPVLLSGLSTIDPAGREVIWSIVQDISSRKAMESELAAAAQRDKLTGLANRAVFMKRLESAIERVQRKTQPYFAVLFLDFDRFKLINDTLGHEAGDDLLRQIAVRLRNVLRATDTLSIDDLGNVVSRFGGDEFLLLINDLKEPRYAIRIAERLLDALAPPYDIQGSEVHSSASIGIITSDQSSSTAEEVVRNADVAMYEAKRAGRACSVVFNEAMHARLTRHVTIENNLRRAIGTAELYLVYQPIIDLTSHRMASAEALVRWNHPTLGAISPSEFIPIAEETGLIVALGQWVQSTACAAMALWRKIDPARAPATISINLSRAELALGQRLMSQLQETLVRCDLPPSCVQLEITEREIMRHPEESRSLMIDLRNTGFKLAMDDFGTGTSSLAVLRNYPFDTIKIDRSFLQDVTSASDVLAVIHATVNLIENLGMASLAEGVEDAAQLAILQSLGCRYAQGYLLGRPVKSDQLCHSDRIADGGIECAQVYVD